MSEMLGIHDDYKEQKFPLEDAPIPKFQLGQKVKASWEDSKGEIDEMQGFIKGLTFFPESWGYYYVDDVPTKQWVYLVFVTEDERQATPYDCEFFECELELVPQAQDSKVTELIERFRIGALANVSTNT